MNIDFLLDQIEGKDLKEWKSRKELEKYLIERKRYGTVIGFVKFKTLEKWKENLDGRGWNKEEDMYILQDGKDYYYLSLRKENKFLYRNKT